MGLSGTVCHVINRHVTAPWHHHRHYCYSNHDNICFVTMATWHAPPTKWQVMVVLSLLLLLSLLYQILSHILVPNIDRDQSQTMRLPSPLLHITMIAIVKTNMQRTQGRLWMKKANKYRNMTIIWSCTTIAQADFGIKRTGRSHWRQYIFTAS